MEDKAWSIIISVFHPQWWKSVILNYIISKLRIGPCFVPWRMQRELFFLPDRIHLYLNLNFQNSLFMIDFWALHFKDTFSMETSEFCLWLDWSSHLQEPAEGIFFLLDHLKYRTRHSKPTAALLNPNLILFFSAPKQSCASRRSETKGQLKNILSHERWNWMHLKLNESQSKSPAYISQPRKATVIQFLFYKLAQLWP